MVQDAKKVASNIRDQPSIKQWRDSNQKLLDSVGKVRKAVAGPEPIPDMNALNLSKSYKKYRFYHNICLYYYYYFQSADAPPRPPLPGGEHPPPRPPPPETDDEDEMFRNAPKPDHPIMVCAFYRHP
jgi:vinculin